MSGYDPQRSFGFLMSEISRLLRRRFDRRARTLGLTRAQWRVLAYLNRNEGINQSALAELLEIEPITLVRQLDRLEAGGLIERRLDPADRRARLLHLTRKARPLLERMRELSTDVRAEALEGFAPAEEEALIETLLAIKARLNAREAASETTDEGADDKTPKRVRAGRRRA
jgi:MarR family transcriptional regulator, transcriptional regulator for hemolysin